MPWDELMQTKNANLEIAKEESMQRPVACPKCGHAPLDENAQGVLNCPLGHWRSDQI
jgi:hypothetical protein